MEIILVLIVFFALYSKQKNLETELMRLKKTISDNNLKPEKEAKEDTLKVNTESEKSEEIKEKTTISLESEFESNKETESYSSRETSAQEDPLEKFINWLKVDWLMKLGAFLFLLATAWFISYAFMNNWIGPVGRITLGIVVGCLIMFFGLKRMEKTLNQGSVFLVLGGVITILTVFAAREYYLFLTPLIALLSIFLIVSFMTFAALKYRAKPIAILSLLLGGLAPLLTNSPDPSLIGLFSYLFVVSLATLWVVQYSNWRELAPLAFAIFFLYNLPYIFSSSPQEELQAMYFSFVFTSIFYLVTLLTININKKVHRADLVMAILNALLLIIWIADAMPEELKGFISILVALIYVVGAYVLFSISKLKGPVYLYSCIAVIFIGAATAFELNGAALTIAFTLEASALLMGVTWLIKRREEILFSSLAMILPIMLSTTSIEYYIRSNIIFSEHFFSLLVLIISLALLFFRFLYIKNHENIDISPLEYISGLALLTYSSLLVWLSFEIIFPSEDTAHMFALFLYTIFGLAFYIRGAKVDRQSERSVGAIILALVVIRLLLVETWNMELTGRIITFFSIAILLIATAFIGRTKKD